MCKQAVNIRVHLVGIEVISHIETEIKPYRVATPAIPTAIRDSASVLRNKSKIPRLEIRFNMTFVIRF